MNTILLSIVLTLMSPLTSIAGVPGDAIVAHLNRIVIPRIEFDHEPVAEAIDFLSMRCVDMDPGPDPARRGISFLTKRPKQVDKNTTTDPRIPANPESIKITYSGKAVPLLVALAEIARQAHLDIYLTEVGIVICQMGDTPFPNSKAENGEVWKTIYKSKSAPTQPQRGEHVVPRVDSIATTRADDKAPENPVAVQFRKHLEDADKNKDGYVTREELAAEIGKDPKRDPQTVEQIVSAMMRDLDTDHDGKLSPAEIAAGALKAGQNASTKQDVNRAQIVMDALIEYKKGHDGAQPTKLEELAKLHLIPDTALSCILADGHEKPWGYETGNRGDDEVILFSPGRVDSEGQYIVGLGDGRVLGLHDTDLDLEKVPRLKMSIVPDK